MREILESYFEAVDQEAFTALQLVALLPLALLIFFLERLSQLTKEVKERAGRRMLRAALCVLPHGSIVGEQIIALLRDRRKHERYEGWCELTRTGPLSFEDWRREQAWVVWAQRKMRVTE